LIPAADIQPTIPSPLPECEMPKPEDISEEGFGWFRGTWFLGRVPIVEASGVVREEAEIIDWLDRVALTPEQFELLATAIETSESDHVPDPLRQRAIAAGLSTFVAEEDFPPLQGLEIGVAGLVYALSAIGCLTAASCRSHISARSWSDCPIVFFAAPQWRLAILSGLVRESGCGLDAGRDMLTVYSRSIHETHQLADLIVCERRQFWRRPVQSNVVSTRRAQSRMDNQQLQLGIERDLRRGES
jgi:hypothetical protein